MLKTTTMPLMMIHLQDIPVVEHLPFVGRPSVGLLPMFEKVQDRITL